MVLVDAKHTTNKCSTISKCLTNNNKYYEKDEIKVNFVHNKHNIIIYASYTVDNKYNWIYHLLIEFDNDDNIIVDRRDK